MKSSREKRWEFRSADDVRHFWNKYRTVASRIDGRKHHHEERYCLGLYLLALADHELLNYPLQVEHSEEKRSPDFMVTWPWKEVTGWEVTRATDELLQKQYTKVAYAARTERKAKLLHLPSFYHALGRDDPELEWCSSVSKAVEDKVAKLFKYRPASRYDLLIYDETPLPEIDAQKAFVAINYRLRALIPRAPLLGKISVIIGRAVVFDLGGDCRIFPYVDWANLKPGDPKEVLAFSQRVEDMACEAVEKAVRAHAAAGRPIHFVDGRGRMIRQMPDGRRLEVKVLDDGGEVVVKEL